MYYMGFSYEETYKLPIPYKRWFIDRVVKEINKGNGDKGDDAQAAGARSRALHQNNPDVRAMQGRIRSQSPSRLRRFT